jgi:AcrR family transcriptional regulator
VAELDARERILAACRREIALNGVRGLRVQRVAKEAGVSLGLVYYHFEDRAGLLSATIDAVNAAVQTRQPEFDPAQAGRETVAELLAAEFGDEEGTREDSVVWNEIRAIAVFERELQEALGDTTRAWEARLAPPLARSGVPDSAIPETATLLTALVEGLSSRWLSGQLDTAAAQRLMRTGSAAILDAAAERPDAPTREREGSASPN